MRITVRLFAILRSREGVDQINVDLATGATLADLLNDFFTTRTELMPLRPHLRVGRGGALLDRSTNLANIVLEDGDEIALLPPASGGAPSRRVARILPAPLNEHAINQLIAEIATEEDGAVVLFVGRTRTTPGTPAPGEEGAATTFANERVVSLTYEAAEPYASAELSAICDRLIAEGLKGEGGIGVIHAVGSVPVGAISVISVVASPHREAAYAASRALIESIKRDVPIWKAEHFASGAVWGANPDALTKYS
ncbi:MAG: molybdenum cofactor biosynthesis protein MoaE [Chloroflexota bacterium]